MKSKTNNRFYLFFIIILLISDLFLNSDGLVYSQMKYIVCALIGLGLLMREDTPVFEALPYNRGLKLRTAILIIVLTLSTMPMTLLLSAFGANVFGNVMESVDEAELFGPNPWVSMLTTALYPAIFEEMFFRGFFFASFRRAGGARKAILLSAALFGLFHMNFQQALYAFVLGVILAILRELTGSMWAGMLFHFVNNGTASLSYFVEQLSEASPRILAAAGAGGNRVIYDLSGYYMPALISAGVTLVLLMLIASIERRLPEFMTFFRAAEQSEENELILTPSLMIGIMLCVFMMLLFFVDQFWV